MKLAASAPPPATAIPFSPPSAAEIATAADRASIDPPSTAVTETAPPAVVSVGTLAMTAATGSVIELRAKETPIETLVLFSPPKPPAIDPAATIASIVEVSSAATVVPVDAMS